MLTPSREDLGLGFTFRVQLGGSEITVSSSLGVVGRGADAGAFFPLVWIASVRTGLLLTEGGQSQQGLSRRLDRGEGALEALQKAEKVATLAKVWAA